MSYKIEEAIGYSFKQYKNSKQKRYHFECDTCDNIVKCTKYSLKTRKSRLCRPCSNRIKLDNARLVGNCNRSRPYEALYNNLVKNSKRREVELDLSYSQFLTFTELNECHYCFQEITWTKYHLSRHGFRTNMDRKDSKIGYTKDNLVQCCWKCNNSKGDRYSYEEWYGMTSYFRK